MKLAVFAFDLKIYEINRSLVRPEENRLKKKRSLKDILKILDSSVKAMCCQVLCSASALSQVKCLPHSSPDHMLLW